MNGPFVVAQANTGGSSGTPVQVLKLIKPPAGQTDVMHASFTGTVKVDFTAIANEKITLFHDSKNQSLHVIFADGSQIIIEPFFDSRGTVLSNLTFEMGPNLFYSGQEFAQNVPITEDQSVLPAAGDAAAAGADFHGFSVDGLGLSNPLGLLPPEELPGLQFTNTGTPLLEQGATPPNLVPGFGAPVLGIVEEESVPANLPQSDAGPGNEDTLDAAGNDKDIPGNFDNTTNQVINGSLAGMVVGGDLPITFNANNAADHHAVIDEHGNPVTSLGSQVYYVFVSPTQIEGWTFNGDPANGGTPNLHVFTLEFAANSAFTFTLTDQIDHHEISHDDGTNPQGIFEETLFLDLTEAITAHDSSSPPDFVTFPPNSLKMGVIDDTPVSFETTPNYPASESEGSGSSSTSQALDDEDQPGGIQGIPSNGDDGFGTQATGQLDIHYGTDGPSHFDPLNPLENPNPLVISATDILVKDSNGNTIPLSEFKAIYVDIDGEGSQRAIHINWQDDASGGGELTGTADGPGGSFEVLKLEVHADGSYTFTLFAPLVHPFNADGQSVNGISEFEDNLTIQFTYTATDFDHDTVDGHITFNVDDDVPTVVAAGEFQTPTVTLDESIGLDGSNVGDSVDSTDDDTGESAPTFPLPGAPLGNQTFGSAIIDGDTIKNLFVGNPGADGEGSHAFGFVLKDANGDPASFGTEFVATNLTITDFNGTGDPSQVYPDDTIYLVQISDTLIQGVVAGADGNIDTTGDNQLALQFTMNALTGEVTVEQFLAIHHNNTADYDESATMSVVGGEGDGGIFASYELTDGDSDSAGAISDAPLSVTVEDDGIGVDVGLATSGEGSGTVTLDTLVLDESINSDRGSDSDGDGANDDNPPVTAPSYILGGDFDASLSSALAIGHTSTPSNAVAGTSVSDLFTITKETGTDGLLDEQPDYTLTLTDNAGNPVLAGSNTGVLTNLFVADTDGSPVEGSADHRAVWLFKVSDTEVIGLTGQDTPGDADDFVALHIFLDVSNPADPILTVEQYLPLEHPFTGPDHFDESIFLNFAGGGEGGSSASLSVTLTDTVTDGDGDTATDSESVTLASVGESSSQEGTSLITFEDDGPVLSATVSSDLVLTHDETAGVQDTNPDNPPSPGTTTEDDTADPFPVVLTGIVGIGSVTIIGQATDGDGGNPFVSTTGSIFGTDGPGGIDVKLQAASPFGSDSGLAVTNGDEIFLFTETTAGGDQVVVGRESNGGLADAAGDIAFIVYVTPDGQTLWVQQYLAIDHGDDGNDFDSTKTIANGALEASISITDADGDSQNLIQAVGDHVAFEDDGPSNSFVSATDTLVHDETPGVDPGSNDVAGPLAVFDPITGKGNDPDVTPADPNDAIGYAQALLTSVAGADFGTDGPGNPAQVFGFTLSANGVYSGLDTTEGDHINLFTENYSGTEFVVGRVSGGANDGKAAFALYIDPNTGEVSLAQYLSIKHDDRGDNDEADDNGSDANDAQPTPALNDLPDPIQQFLASGTLSVVVMFTDGDGDHIQASADISSRIIFEDDGPSLTVGPATSTNPITATALDLDETIQPDGAVQVATFDHYNGAETESVSPPSNGGADDVDPDGLTPFAFNHPVYLTAPTNAQAIGELKTNVVGGLGSLFSVSGVNFGADGPATQDSRTDTLSLVLSLNGAQTALSVTAVPGSAVGTFDADSRVIYLYQVDSTHIEGRILGADNAVGGGDDFVAFKITLLNPTDPANAQIQVDQFMAIEHSDQNLFDSQALMTLLGGNTFGLHLETTLTDGDGDPVIQSATVNLVNGETSFLSFDDDGPTASGSTASIVLDDEGQPLGQLSPTSPEDVDTPESATTVTGTLTFAAGTDGLKSIAVDTAVTSTDSNNVSSNTIKVVYVNPTDENHGTPETVTFSWVPDVGGDGGTLYGLSTHYNTQANPAIELRVHQDGTYTLTMHAPLAHPYTDPDFLNNGPELGYEDNLILNFKYLITDGDNDTTSATLSVNVDDDKPVAFTPEDATLDNAAGSATFALDVFGHTGADGLGTVTFINVTNGQAAQAGGDPLTSGGDPIYYYFGSNGTDHTVLIGSTVTPAEFNNGAGINPSTEAVFQITLHPDAATQLTDTYTVEVFATVDNGAGINFDNFANIGSPGHTDFLVADLPGTQDLIIQATVTGDAVNTATFEDSVDIGTNNQMINNAEGIILDFVNLTDGTTNPPTYSTHNNVNNAKFMIAQVQGNPANTVDVFVRAFDADDDNVYEPRVGDAGDNVVAITDILVNGVSVFGSAVLFDPDGFGNGYVIQNLNDHDVVQVVTATGLERLQISNAVDLGGNDDYDGSNFTVTDIAVGTVSAGAPVNLAFDVLMTDGDGDGITAGIEVGLEPAAPPLLQSTTFTGLVEEEELAHTVSPPIYAASFIGAEDQTAGPPDNDSDTANSGAGSHVTTNVALGAYSVLGGTGPYNFHFASGLEGTQAQFADSPFPMTSHGENVLLHVNGNTLTGYTNVGAAGYVEGVDHVIFTFQITNAATGAATFTLYDNVDHHVVASADNLEATRALNLNGIVEVTDSSGPPQTLALNGSIGIIDDIPVTQGDTNTAQEGHGGKSDVVLILDHSASMAGQRLADLKAAITDLFNSGNVHAVFLVSFSSDSTFHNSGVNGGWYTDLNAALSVVNSLTASGFTDYDAALAAITANFTAPPPGGSQLVSMFLSDGQPNEANGTNSIGIDEDTFGGSHEESAWINFLVANGFDSSYAFGFGDLTNADKAQLEPIAWTPGETADNPYDADLASGLNDPKVIIVANTSDLSGVLIGAVIVPVNGNVLTNDAFGADGPHVVSGTFDGILSITVNGFTYTFDGTAITIPPGATGSPTVNGGTLDVDTTLGGHLTFHFANGVGFIAGDYSYTPPVNVNSNQHEIFHYVIVDGDGDRIGADLDITVQDLNVAPVAANDVLLTNLGGSPYSVPEWAFLANDNDPNLDRIDMNAVTSQTSLNSVIHTAGTGTNGTVDIDDNGSGGTGSFTYNDTDGILISADATVSVNNQNGGNLTGTSASEIFFGDSAGTTFTGNGGNDIFIAGAGSDSIVLGTGSDLVVENSVVAASSDSGRVAVAGNNNDTGQDTITNFNLTNDILQIIGTNVSNFTHGTDTAIGTQSGGVNDGTVGSFLNTTGLVNLSHEVTLTVGTGDVAVTFASPVGTLDEANFEARIQYNLTGTSGDDTITTGTQNDTLDGSGGNDALTGGVGNDTYTGGSGNDSFVLSGLSAAANGHDTILDFVSGSDDVFVDVASQALTIGTAAAVAAGDFHTGNETNAATWAGGSGANEFVWNNATKELWYSANGTGTDKIDLAHISTGVPTAADVHTF